MTEAELKQQILEISRGPGHFGTLAGLRYDWVDRTGGEGYFEAGPEQCNPYGIVHGGVYYALMDQLSGMAACCCGRGAVTLDANVSYLRAARAGDTVRCKLSTVHMGKSVAVYRGECRDKEGQLLATGEFRLFLLETPLEKMVD